MTGEFVLIDTVECDDPVQHLLRILFYQGNLPGGTKEVHMTKRVKQDKACDLMLPWRPKRNSIKRRSMKDRLLFLLPVVFLLIGCTSDRGHMETVEIETEIPVMNVYEGKLVYTTDMQADPKPFREDCQSRGGVFNQCGDVCEPGVSFCAEVCAYTCELGGEKSPGTEPGG